MSAVLRRFLSTLSLAVCCLLPAAAFAQHPHNIPDFCASPTRTLTAGSWSAQGVAAGAVVRIPSGVTVIYDAPSSTPIKSICVAGTLIVVRGSDTTLRVSELVVESGGVLDWGTAASPVTATAVIEFAGTLDAGTVSAPGGDPEQFGVGLLAFGTVRMHGLSKTSFVRLAAAPGAGATSIILASVPIGWHAGDAVVFPESQQRSLSGSSTNPSRIPAAFQQTTCGGQYCTYDDRRVLAAPVTTAIATLTTPLTHAHPGGLNANGVVDYFPHVANLSRNVIVRSVDPAGVRGHTLFTERVDVDIRYTLFSQLGRTTDANLHCTLATTGAKQEAMDCAMGTGALTQIGTNQKGRYAVHFHHLWGPVNASDTGDQGTFLGNSVVDSTKWPVSIHWTSYLLFQANVIAYGRGPALFMEEYNEHFNVIDGNLFTGMRGFNSPREQSVSVSPGDFGGREASGLWSRSTHNYFRNNVSAGHWNDAQQIVTDVGYKFAIRTNPYQSRVPKFRGADLTDPAAYTTAPAMSLPLLEFAGNEAYGMSTGLTIWRHGTTGYTLMPGQPVSTVKGLVVWNVYEQGVFAYPIYNYVFDGLIVRGDPKKLSGNRVTPVGWTTADYKAHTVTIRNSDLQNVGIGIGGTSGVDGPLTIENTVIKAATAGVQLNGFYTPGTGANPLTPRLTIMRGLDFTALNGFSPRPLWMNFDPTGNCCAGRFHGDTLPYLTTVENYRNSGMTFDVYFGEQATLPYAGGLAPCNDTTTYPEITGIVCNIRGVTPPVDPCVGLTVTITAFGAVTVTTNAGCVVTSVVR